MKNSKTKKILSILLALVMLVGMIPTIAFAATEKTTVTQIELTGVHLPKVGNKCFVKDEAGVTTPSDAAYEFSPQYYSYRDISGTSLTSANEFEAGKQYYTLFNILIKDGFKDTHAFSADSAPTIIFTDIDESQYKNNYSVSFEYIEDTFVRARIDFTLDGDAVYPPINTLVLDDYKTPVNGQSLASWYSSNNVPVYNYSKMTSLTYLMPDGSKINSSEYDKKMNTDVESGKKYGLEMIFEANENYTFADVVSISVGAGNPTITYTVSTDKKTLTVELWEEVSDPDITSIEFGLTSQAAVINGNTVEKYADYWVTESSDKYYAYFNAFWYEWKDEAGNIVTGQKFENGKKYIGKFDFRAETGHSFADDVTINITSGGKYVSHKVTGYSGSQISLEVTVTPIDPWVRNIDVSATWFGTPADATSSTPSAGVTETKWYKQNGSSWTELGASDTFKEGNTYRCEVTVAPTYGCQLANGYTVKINGIDATKKSGDTWYRDVTITGYTSYIDMDDIDLPEAFTNPDFTYNDEEGAAYHWDVVQVEWFECDQDGHKLSDALPADHVFEKGGYYRVEVTVVPETNWQFRGSDLSFYINDKAAMPIYGYNKAYPDSVTGYVVYNTADIEGNYELFVYDDSLSGSAKNIYIKDGQYLGSDATAPSDTEPSGGYAYYKDGVLELNGYDNEKAHFIFEEAALELWLIGDNTIGAIYDNEWGMAGGNLETRQGNLVINANPGGKLVIASNPLDAYANIQVKDLYFKGGDVTSCLANGTYGAAVQLNGDNLYLEKGTAAYVSDTNDFATATKWDGTTDISNYDCVWLKTLGTYQVVFIDDDTVLDMVRVTEGSTVSEPEEPVKDGYTFLGWYTQTGDPFDFDTPITQNVFLYAEFEEESIELRGDVNLDGVIDVNDYQLVVNEALSDGNEQIGTAEYDDIIKYDLDGDGYLDVIDCAIMALIVNGHREVHYTKKGDYDLDGEAYTESDLIAMYHVLSDIEGSAPTLSTLQKYASDLNCNGKVDEDDLAILTGRYGTIEETTCEENIKVYYRWGNSYTTCTATAICTICDKHVAKETVNSVKNADGSYTATFTNTLLGTKTYKKQ